MYNSREVLSVYFLQSVFFAVIYYVHIESIWTVHGLNSTTPKLYRRYKDWDDIEPPFCIDSKPFTTYRWAVISLYMLIRMYLIQTAKIKIVVEFE